jgi:methionyl aminopeptidase
MIPLKNKKEIQLMAKSGSIAAEILASLAEHLAPGVSTQQLDELADSLMADHNALPSFKGFRGYPACICASVNDVVVHGIPSPDVLLREGDIISIDLGVIYQGYHADTAATFPIGEITPEVQHLIAVTETARELGVAHAIAGRPLSDLSHAIQAHVEANHCSVIRALTGHGIGRSLHEEPAVPNFDDGNPGPTLKAGMALAIEPMVSLGDHRVRVDSDGWTLRTLDGSISAHFEHTIVVEANGPRILTNLPRRPESSQTKAIQEAEESATARHGNESVSSRPLVG